MLGHLSCTMQRLTKLKIMKGPSHHSRPRLAGRKLVALTLVSFGLVSIGGSIVQPVLKEPVYFSGVPDSLKFHDSKRPVIMRVRVWNMRLTPVEIIQPPLAGCWLPSNSILPLPSLSSREIEVPIHYEGHGQGWHQASIGLTGMTGKDKFDITRTMLYYQPR